MKIKYGDLIRIIIKDGGLEMIALEYEDITSLCDVFYRVRKYLITSGLCIPVRVQSLILIVPYIRLMNMIRFIKLNLIFALLCPNTL